MKQALHILAKDVRRFWPEILISLGITAAFVLIEPFRWKAQENGFDSLNSIFPGLLGLLMPVSWWVLIARVIHEERLVGNTQFWITRPYEWKRLLSSKVLFLQAFLILPLFLAQSLILSEGGFHPLSFVHGLLYSLLLLSAFLVIPLAAFAVITSTFARMTLTMLGVLLAMIAVVTVATLLFSSNVGVIAFPLRDSISFWVYLAVMAIAITLAYALRKPWISRLLLVAVPMVIGAVMGIASHFQRAYVEHRYPTTANAAFQNAPLLQLAYPPNPGATSSSSTSYGLSRATNIGVAIPLEDFGVAEGTVVIPDGIRAEITGPDGSRWESDWQLQAGYHFNPVAASDREHFNAVFMMPLHVYYKFRSKPVNVHLTFAVTEAREVREDVIPLIEGRFVVPDFGTCSAQSGGSFSAGITGIGCLSPLREPPLTFISAHWSSGPCSAGNAAAEDGVVGVSWVGSPEREAAKLNFSSVVDLHINLSNNFTDGQPITPRFLCPGAPVHFRQYGMARRTQASVDVQGYQLPEVTVEGNRVTVTNRSLRAMAQ